LIVEALALRIWNKHWALIHVCSVNIISSPILIAISLLFAHNNFVRVLCSCLKITFNLTVHVCFNERELKLCFVISTRCGSAFVQATEFCPSFKNLLAGDLVCHILLMRNKYPQMLSLNHYCHLILCYHRYINELPVSIFTFPEVAAHSSYVTIFATHVIGMPKVHPHSRRGTFLSSNFDLYID